MTTTTDVQPNGAGTSNRLYEHCYDRGGGMMRPHEVDDVDQGGEDDETSQRQTRVRLSAKMFYTSRLANPYRHPTFALWRVDYYSSMLWICM